MSESSFAALESTMLQDAVDISALSDENARLRELLAAHTSQPTIILSPSPDEPIHSASPSFSFPQVSALATDDLAAQLAAERAAAAELARELAALKAFQNTVVKHAVEAHDDELSLLRQSLATLASALEEEKARVNRIEEERKREEAARRAEEEKVSTLRKTVDESRRALMRLQNEASKTSKRQSVDYAAPSPVNRRLSVGGVYDSTPKRRSSLGPAPINLTVGLGLSADSPERSPAMLLATSPSSSSSHGKQSSLLRATHRRGSASIAVMDSGEEDRTNRLRDLRLNVNTTKVHSRRGSAASSAGDLLSPTEGPERMRIPSFSFPQGANPFAMNRTQSISEESEGSSSASRRGSTASWLERGPPSAPLRAAGRNNSVAMFEPWSRRSSNASDVSFGGYGGFGAPGMMRRLSMGSVTGSESGYESVAETSHLRTELQGLRIQLAEAEEGRRASELCLNALKEYIQTGSDGTLSLPPLPTEREKPASSSWSISSLTSQLPSSLPFSSRKPSAFASPSVLSLPGARGSPNLTSFDSFKPRNASISSVASTAASHPTPNAGASAPIFGGFSFSALVSRASHIVDGDTSPTMTGQAEAEGSFPTEPSPLIPDEDEAGSVEPSLTSASECGDSESERSSSPVGGDAVDAVAIAGEFGKLVLNEEGNEFVLPPLSKDADPTTPRLGLGFAC